jgi:hypothetical protein
MSARTFVAGALLVFGMTLGSAGFILASYVLWEVISIAGELLERGRRHLLRGQAGSDGATAVRRRSQAHLRAAECTASVIARG